MVAMYVLARFPEEQERLLEEQVFPRCHEHILQWLKGRIVDKDSSVEGSFFIK